VRLLGKRFYRPENRGRSEGGEEVTQEGEVVGIYIGTFLKYRFKIYPKQLGGQWTATWTLTRPDGDQEEFPARGEFDTIKGATDAAIRHAKERVRELERGLSDLGSLPR
jgi:hypothetical protein